MLTKEQLAERHTFIGASEAAAVLGLNPWKEPLDVYASKTVDTWGANEGPIDDYDGAADDEDEREEDPFSTLHLDVGNAIEPLIVRLFTERHGWKVVDQANPEHPGTMRHPRFSMIAATPDGIVFPGGGRAEGLECKWAGSRRRRDWGPSGTTIPDYYVPQVQVGMAVFGLYRWHVAAIVDGSPRFYVVERDQALIDAWIGRLVAWWEAHVVARVPPPAQAPGAATAFLKAMYPRSTGTLLPATEEDLDVGRKLAAAKVRAKATETEIELLEAALKARIGAADGIEGVATWKSEAKGRVAWSKVAADLTPPPELIARHTSAPVRKFLCKVKGA